MSQKIEPGQNLLRLTGRDAEEALHKLILDLCVDDVVLHYILPAGKPHSFETSLWDYKAKLPNTSGRGLPEELASDQLAIAELVKDIAAFHNSFGGYLLAGIEEHADEPTSGCGNLNAAGFTVEKLNEQVFAYTKTQIGCRFRKLTIEKQDGSSCELGLLVIPMRDSSSSPVRMMRGAPEVNGKSKFKKGSIFARIDDACVPVNEDAQGLKFVCSERKFDLANATRHLEHNLPLPDPNLVRFIGRSDYLYFLWSWLTEKHTPVKVITALGGTGKTAIAYEFCLQFLSSPPAWATKILWLSAKKQNFLAFMGIFSKTTRTDFDGVASCLAAIAMELGSTEEEVTNATGDTSDLLDLAFAGLMAFPALVIIDDIDTLELAEQENLFSTIQSLAGQTFLGGTRFLVTSRLEFGAETQRIKLAGFSEKEFSEYISQVATSYQVSIPDAALATLYRASLGSPIFCSSILRAVSLGMDIYQAIRSWKGKEGEEVRKFAFQRELGELSESASRTLYALSVLGETNFLELRQVLEVEASTLLEDLSSLRKFHLYASSGDPRTGTKLEVPEPIMLMRDILAERLTDPRRIERECARARSKSPRLKDKISIIMASIVALWKEDSYEDALAYAVDAAKVNKTNADLFCVLGQCHMKVKAPRFDEADKAFREAIRLGSTRPELVPNWIEAKRRMKDWGGITDLVARTSPSDLRGEAAFASVEAIAQLALQAVSRGDRPRAVERFLETMKLANRIVAQGRAGDRVVDVRELCRGSAHRYVSLVDEHSSRAGDRLDVFNAVVDAYDCHITESALIVLGVDALIQWAEDALQRPAGRGDAASILNKRLEKLRQIILHLEEQDRPRVKLISDLASANYRLTTLVVQLSA